MKNSIKLIFLFLFMITLSACSSLPTDYVEEPTYAVTRTSQTTLGKKASEILGGNPDQSVMYLVNEGTDAFFARMLLLSQAERSIDVQYFIWHADLIGKLLFNEMILAADRGVRVRILLDDINIDEEIETILYAMDQHENIDVHLYNPFANRGMRVVDYVTDAFRVNRRMHNKSFTVDNQVTVVGGRNIGNEYFSADEESNFKDIDVLAIGPVVADVEEQFDIYWNSKVVLPVKAFDHNQATPADLEKLKKELAEFKQAQLTTKYALDIQDSEMYQRWKNATSEPGTEKTFRGDVKVIYDDPEKSMGKSDKEIVYLKSLMAPHLEQATQTFEIVSPYFVPGDEGTEYLTGLVKKGLKVRVITNSLSSTDGIMAQSGYARHRIELLKGGVELYELKADTKSKASRSLRRSAKAKSGLHAKTYIFDREEVFIGSFNFDQRSANINSEVGIIYQIPKMAQLIAKSAFDTAVNEHTYRVELVIEHEDIDGIDVAQEKVVWVETKDGKEYRYTTEPGTSGWRRFNEDVFSILPIESQL
jgi:putative cardiolipin synthase